MESLSLNSWARHVQYHCLRELLGPAINTHLAGNELLREVFQMGPPPIVTVETKAAKLDRVSICTCVGGLVMCMCGGVLIAFQT